MLLTAETYQALVDPVTVMLHSWQADGAYLPALVAYCQRSGAESGADSTSAGVTVPRARCYFHLWAANLPAGVIPKNPDVIEDDAGVRWTVLDAQRLAHGARYKCLCQQEAP